jgi:flagellar basal-body rod protein FlgF
MNEVLAIALQGMQADAARLDLIGMNLANALTAGYKRGVAVQAPVGATFAAHLSGAASAASSGSGGPGAIAVHTDSRAGTLKATGQPLDIALAGRGYFEVVTENGPAYTRQGQFRVDAAGRLVTPQGYPVMGANGEITLNNPNPVMTSSGMLIAPGDIGDAPLAQLKVVDFEPGESLRPLGDGLVAAGSGMKQLAPADVQLRQGYLENSNVATTYEMTQLVKAMRHFESMHKVAQGFDDMVGGAIRKLADN